MTKLSTILDQIDSRTVLLPEFQRGYVWNREQVRRLMRSLYRGYPVGALLVWETEADPGLVRGTGTAGSGVKLLLLDGQQRITSLYGIMRGQPPAFFEGDKSAFTGLRFHVEDETFEFYAPVKMKDDPRWIDVTDLFRHGLEPQIKRLSADADAAPMLAGSLAKLAKLHGILDREFHEEKITGADKNVDDVVEIFNRVNSGGTKLSKGDLALAKLCASWPDARATMRGHLAHWLKAGYKLNLDWLLRNTTAVVTGRSQFEHLDGVTAHQFETGLTDSAKHVSLLLDIVQGRLGLDHDRVLMGRYAFPVMVRLLHRGGGKFVDWAHTERVLYWYIHSALWGRFAGSTETILAQDYETLERDGIDGLIAALERWRGGNLAVRAHDFEATTMGSRFYPLLYLLTRTQGARDFGTGLELKAGMLGHLSGLQVHHIFPKALLYQHGYKQGEVNAVANFCFLTQQTNLAIGKRSPEDYFAEAELKNPGALASQWIPADPRLWKIENYGEFLAARRELLAAAANRLLDGLRSGSHSLTDALPALGAATSDDDQQAEAVKALAQDLVDLGYAEPALDSEISDPETGALLCVAEAFWPDGLQPGIGDPVVLEVDEDIDLSRLEELGYRVFTSMEHLRRYVARLDSGAANLA